MITGGVQSTVSADDGATGVSSLRDPKESEYLQIH